MLCSIVSQFLEEFTIKYRRPKMTDQQDGNVRTWTPEQRDEIISSVVKNLPKSKEKVAFDLAQKYVFKPAILKRKIREIFLPGRSGLVKKIEGQYPESLLEFHDGWVDFYNDVGMRIDLNDFPLPPIERLNLEEGKEYWSIVVPDGMNPQTAFQLRKELTPVYEDTSVSKIIDVYPRVKVSVIRAEQNAMILHPNISLNESMRLGLFGTTFTEGCLIDGRVFKDLGIHLDENGWTLHSGSRSEDGDAVYSRWGDVRFEVDWHNPDYSYSRLSPRQKQY